MESEWEHVFVEAPEGRAREIKQGRRCCSLVCSDIIAAELQFNQLNLGFLYEALL